MAHVVIDGVPLNSINHKRPAVEGVPSPPSTGMSLSFGSQDGILSCGRVAESLEFVGVGFGGEFFGVLGGFGSSGLACGMSTSVRNLALFLNSSLSSGCVALNVGDLLLLLVDLQCRMMHHDDTAFRNLTKAAFAL